MRAAAAQAVVAPALVALSLLLAAATPAAAQTTPYEEPLVLGGMEMPGPPPKLGDIEARLGGKPSVWETYDFSVGAFDASAWIDYYDGIVLTLQGFPVGQAEVEGQRLSIRATFDGMVKPGDQGKAVRVELFDRNFDGPRQSSKGRAASLTVTRVESGPDTSGYGHISGTFTARLCPMAGKNGPCRQIEGRFDTGMQYQYPPR